MRISRKKPTLYGGVFEQAGTEDKIKKLEDELRKLHSADIPYVQITREVASQYPAVVSLLEGTAERAGISTQRDILRDGGTDAGAIHTAGAGALTGGISVPCRYVHTPVETVSLRDCVDCIRLTAAFACAELKPLRI